MPKNKQTKSAYFLNHSYAGTALKIPVKRTRADHKPAPLQIMPCDLSHSPGVARITGTATVIANETIIRRITNTGRIPTI